MASVTPPPALTDEDIQQMFDTPEWQHRVEAFQKRLEIEESLRPHPPTHSEVVNARIAAFDRAVATIRNSARPGLQEKDILRLAVELVK